MKPERRVALYKKYRQQTMAKIQRCRPVNRASCCNFEVGRYMASTSNRGVSGARDIRPQLDRLMSDAKRRRFRIVAVWKFDRFARSISHLLRALEEFQTLGIEFFSLSEQIDTTTPMGKWFSPCWVQLQSLNVR